jgi:hypothetical protein
MTHKKSPEISCFEVLDVLFLRAESFSSPFNFRSSKPRTPIRTGIQLKMLDPDPESINPYPKHCIPGQRILFKIWMA